MIALLLVRSALSQMDVPTRSSYVMAIVHPAERPAAASITVGAAQPRLGGEPVLAGYLLALSAFGWPLVAAGGAQDRLRPAAAGDFRKVRPPEERAAALKAGAPGAGAD